MSSYFPNMAKPAGSHSFLIHINQRSEYVCYSIGDNDKFNGMAVGNSLQEMCQGLLRTLYPNAEVTLNNEDYFCVDGIGFVEEACAILNSKKSSARRSILLYLHRYTSGLDRWIDYDQDIDTFSRTEIGRNHDEEKHKSIALYEERRAARAAAKAAKQQQQ